MPPTTKKIKNQSFGKAKDAKQDEFYTQLSDIERELRHYKHYFRGKVVYCNCDDPRISNFFHYFSHNFEVLDGSAEKAAALDLRIVEAAAGVDLAIRTDLMTRTPNTIQAHRLIWFAGQKNVQDAAMEAVFKAYFTEGADIGDNAVLADCAAAASLNREESLAFLSGDLADKEMRAADAAARETGVNGVPSFFLDGYGLFSGAMPADSIANALRKGQQALRQKAAA